jgi:hypothetical protein
MQITERIKRLETKLSHDAESQAARQRLREELTEFLYTLRAWAKQNLLLQTPDRPDASEMKIPQELESQGFQLVLQQAITEHLEALRALARQNGQPQTFRNAEAFRPDGAT